MNRIVREHYPVSKLPEDLREGLEGQADVRVTIDASGGESSTDEDASTKASDRPGQFTQFKNMRRSNYASMEEVVDYVRSLRDEWTDREQ